MKECVFKKRVPSIKRNYFYQSSMCVACAASGVAAGGRLLLRRLVVVVVVVGVGEDQTLRGRRGRWFSSTNHRLLQQRGEVQTNTGLVSKVY